MGKYIHIGFPKNLSTTLQRGFFSQHPEIFHLGVGINTNIDYIDENINLSCEQFFQYSKGFVYNSKREYIHNSFEKWFDYFEGEKRYKITGISLELLSFSWTPEQIDTAEKARRVFDVFGKNTKIIILIRNQHDLLKSLYREAIKLGYFGDFNDFMKYTYIYQDRNFLHDFLYDNIFLLYSKYFGEENICMIPIEDVRNADGTLKLNEIGKNLLVLKLCKLLNVNYYDLELGHYNEPLSTYQLAIKRRLNKINRHDLGNPVFGPSANSHRLKYYYNNFLKMNLKEAEIFKDVIIKRDLIKKASCSSFKINHKIGYNYDRDIKKRLDTLFSKSNYNLSKLLNRQLPDKYIL